MRAGTDEDGAWALVEEALSRPEVDGRLVWERNPWPALPRLGQPDEYAEPVLTVSADKLRPPHA
jgi:hypothetical protein